MSPPPDPPSWRTQLLQTVLDWSLVLGGIIAVVELFRGLVLKPELAGSVAFWLMFALYLGLYPLRLLPLPEAARAWGVVLLFAAMGLQATAGLGMLPGPVLALSMSVLLAALLLGRAALLVTLALGTASLLAIGVAASEGLLAPAYAPGGLREWVGSVITFGALSGVLAAMAWSVVGQLEQALARSEVERLRAEEATHKRVRAEKRLQQAHRLEALGTLAGGIAHDFNNALQVIIGWVQLLREDIDDPEAASALGQVEQTALSAAGLTRQLLAFSRPQPSETRSVDVAALAVQWSEALRRVLPVDYALRLDLQRVPAVQADPSLLQQALLNLITNARDASAPGCAITIGASLADAEQVEAAGLDAGTGWVDLWVSDTGEGIDEDQQARIFEPFFTTKPDGKGHGLGLAMVYGSIQQLGGAVTVDSAPGEGSTFHILLPAQEAAPRAAAPPPAPAEALAGRVLLAEDEPDVRAVLAVLLRRAGLEVVEARDGTAASLILQQDQRPFALLCIDGVMPGTPTAEVIDTFLQRDGGVVLVCSGHLIDEGVTRRVQAGEISFLAKPFTPDQLRARIQALLSTR